MNDLVSILSMVGLIAAMAVVAGAAGYWCGKIDGNIWWLIFVWVWHFFVTTITISVLIGCLHPKVETFGKTSMKVSGLTCTRVITGRYNARVGARL